MGHKVFKCVTALQGYKILGSNKGLYYGCNKHRKYRFWYKDGVLYHKLKDYDDRQSAEFAYRLFLKDILRGIDVWCKV